MQNPTEGALARAAQTARATFWRSARRLRLIRPDYTMEDQGKDRFAPFDEYPPCDSCGGTAVTEKLVAKDGSRIVECDHCGLWFTSPRINEAVWVRYLQTPTERSREFTENRLRYGVALSSNVKFVLPGWFERRMRLENAIIDRIQKHLDAPIHRLHDVGCGVGFLLRAARDRGINASGNDLNQYAWQVMQERFGLTVYNDSLPRLELPPESVDAVVMRDYIEHSYHPMLDLHAAHKLLRPGGVVYVETFHIDSRPFEELGAGWNMLFWSHTYHYSTKTLSDMVSRAGLAILEVQTSHADTLVRVTARKE